MRDEKRREGKTKRTREREEERRSRRATKRTGVGYAHEGRLKGEKEEDGIKRGKKGGGESGSRREGEKEAGGRYTKRERERERPREKWAPSERGQPQATSHDATLLREGFVPSFVDAGRAGSDEFDAFNRSSVFLGREFRKIGAARPGPISNSSDRADPFLQR